MRPPVFYVVGPTAIGKSEIAAEIAAHCGGEIVGADAFQVYEDFDLLTAKPSAEVTKRALHHLIGCISPEETFSVSRYQELAQETLREIQARGRPAIVAGGAGLYIKALTHGLSPLPPADPALRAELEAQDPAALLAKLRALDPAAAGFIDPKNLRRVVRALEVCLVTGGQFSDHRSQWAKTNPDPAPLGILLTCERPELHDRINRRVEFMFDCGVVDEVRATFQKPLGQTASRIIGLAEIRALLAGGITLLECKEGIKAATRQYAKRQMTWFRRETAFVPVDITSAENLPDALSQIERVTTNYGSLRELTATISQKQQPDR